MRDEGELGQSASTHGSGQTVLLAVNETTTKWMIGVFGLLVGLCIFGVIVSLSQTAQNARDFAKAIGDQASVAAYAKASAEQANTAAQAADMEARVKEDKVDSMRLEIARLTGLVEPKQRKP